MMTSVVVLNTQMYSIKLRSSKLIIKSDGQKKMVEYDLNVNFMTLSISKLDFFSSSLN